MSNSDMNVLINKIYDEVMIELKNVESDDLKIPVGVSNRHVHLTDEDVEALFPKGYKLTPLKDLSQPNQYACKETVEIVTEKGSIKNVRILGPTRSKTQVEISKTDARTLGISAPLRNSGDTKGSSDIIIKYLGKKIVAKESVIVAKRHIHMHTDDAAKFNVKDNDEVSIKFDGERGGILNNVTIRVSEDFRLDCHLDTDEANAFSISNGSYVEIVN